MQGTVAIWARAGMQTQNKASSPGKNNRVAPIGCAPSMRFHSPERIAVASIHFDPENCQRGPQAVHGYGWSGSGAVPSLDFPHPSDSLPGVPDEDIEMANRKRSGGIALA